MIRESCFIPPPPRARALMQVAHGGGGGGRAVSEESLHNERKREKTQQCVHVALECATCTYPPHPSTPPVAKLSPRRRARTRCENESRSPLEKVTLLACFVSPPSHHHHYHHHQPPSRRRPTTPPPPTVGTMATQGLLDGGKAVAGILGCPNLPADEDHPAQSPSGGVDAEKARCGEECGR